MAEQSTRVLAFVLLLIFTTSIVFAEDKASYTIPPKLSAEEIKDAPSLSDASVYPAWGVPCTNFTYKVMYQDKDGREPAYVRINLNDEWHDMAKISGDYESGASYAYNYIPTSGKENFYYFEASNGFGKARDGIIDSPDQGPMLYPEKFDNNAIILLKKDSNTPVWKFETGKDMVSAVSLSKDGKYAAAVTYSSIYLFSTNSSEPIWRFCERCEEPPIAMNEYRGVALSADGMYAAASLSDTLYLFKKDDNKPIWSANIESNAIGIAISDDGEYIAVGVGNANEKGDKIFLFSKTSNKPIFEYKPSHPGYVQTGNFYRPDITSDGKYIAVSTGCPDRKAYLFAKDGKIIFQSEPLTEDSPVHKSAIADDGSIVAYSADHSQGKEIVFVFDKNGNKLWSFSSAEDSSSRAVSVSSDGEYIAAGTTKGRVYLFSKDSNTPLWKFSDDGNFAQVGDVKLSPDGSYLAAGTSTKKVYLFSKNSSNPVWTYTAPTWINAIDFNGDYIVAGTGLLEYLFEGGNAVSPEEIVCKEIIQIPSNTFMDGNTAITKEGACGDSICEPMAGENKETCKLDCSPDGLGGIINDIEDKINDTEDDNFQIVDDIIDVTEENITIKNATEEIMIKNDSTSTPASKKNEESLPCAASIGFIMLIFTFLAVRYDKMV